MWWNIAIAVAAIAGLGTVGYFIFRAAKKTPNPPGSIPPNYYA